MLFTALLLSSTASAATPLTSGELYDTAHTTEQGTTTVRILNPSSYAVSDQLQLKTSLLGLIGGPNLAAEYGIMSGSDSAFSVEVGAGAGWNFNSYSAGASGVYTMGPAAGNKFNVSAGVNLAATNLSGESTSTLGVPVGVSYHLVPSDQVTVQFFGNTNVMNLVDSDSAFTANGGFRWNKGWDKFRLALGLTVFVGGLGEVAEALEGTGLEDNLPSVIAIPLPTIGFWWRV